MPAEPDAKSKALREHSSLNPDPEAVTDSLFQNSPFFDARDLVLVKYEMLRRVRIDGFSITEAATTFGFSRPAFYQAQANFEQKGLPGLIPKLPGPRRAHKLSESVMDFVESLLLEDKMLPTAELVSAVEERFEVSVHPRSIERAIVRRRKKGR